MDGGRPATGMVASPNFAQVRLTVSAQEHDRGDHAPACLTMGYLYAVHRVLVPGLPHLLIPVPSKEQQKLALDPKQVRKPEIVRAAFGAPMPPRWPRTRRQCGRSGRRPGQAHRARPSETRSTVISAIPSRPATSSDSAVAPSRPTGHGKVPSGKPYTHDRSRWSASRRRLC
jgi:hypothetical protein